MYVVEIKDPNNRTVYDSHPRNEDMEVWLDSGSSATRTFNWRIPDGSTAGTYQVNASLRDWNNWDKIYDYRWGDKLGPSFNCPPIANHASFEAWCPFGSYLALKLDYSNTLAEDVLFVFYISDLNDIVVGATSHHTFFGDAVAKKGTSSTVHAISQSLRRDTSIFKVFWKAYLTSDTTLSNPIDESTPAEEMQFTWVYGNIENTVLPIPSIENILVLFDGKEIGMADNYADVLNPNDENVPEYLVLLGARSTQVLVSIPHFSTHTIEITRRGQEVPSAQWVIVLGLSLIAIIAVATVVILKRR